MKAVYVSCLLVMAAAMAITFTYWDDLHNVREMLQLTYQHCLLSADRDAPFKDVTIFRNGYSTGGVQMQLSAELLTTYTEQGELAAYLSQFIEVEGLDDVVENSSGSKGDFRGAVANRVFNGRGELVQTYTDIIPGDRLYLVAPGLLFVWPFVELGHRVIVTSNVSPTKKPVIIESMSESPRVFRLHNFFSHEEADALISRMLEIDDPVNKLQPSTVANSDAKRTSKHRTSENAFDSVSETAVTIRKRVFDILSLGEFQEEMCDGLQLLRYQQKQAYIPHMDYFPTDSAQGFNFDPHKGGSNRFATVFLYLSDVTRGGQTVFPDADMPEALPAEYKHPLNAVQIYEAARAELFEPGSWELDMVRKCSTKLASYPSKGGAVLFYSQKPNGELDPKSNHGGCPVLEGTKWGANLWVWNKRRYGLTDKTTACSVTFMNPTSRQVGLYWASTLMHTLEGNGGSMVFTSYTGHEWTIKHGEQVLLTFPIDCNVGKEQTVVVPLAANGSEDDMKSKDEL